VDFSSISSCRSSAEVASADSLDKSHSSNGREVATYLESLEKFSLKFDLILFLKIR